MSYYIFKIVFTGFFIVLISEITKVSGKLGSIITAMPLTTLIVVFWLYYEKVPNHEIADYVSNTLYFIYTSIVYYFPFINSKVWIYNFYFY